MLLEPVLRSSAAIQIHLAAVVPAFILGAIILLRPKGTKSHRVLGRLWLAAMLATAVSSFFIRTIDVAFGFSPIHLLSVLVIAGCVSAVAAARAGRIEEHRRTMRGLYVWGIGIAGTFAFTPGRLMHELAFGVENVFARPHASRLAPFIEAGAGAAVGLVAAALLCAAALVTALVLALVRARVATRRRQASSLRNSEAS